MYVCRYRYRESQFLETSQIYYWNASIGLNYFCRMNYSMVYCQCSTKSTHHHRVRVSKHENTCSFQKQSHLIENIQRTENYGTCVLFWQALFECELLSAMDSFLSGGKTTVWKWENCLLGCCHISNLSVKKCFTVNADERRGTWIWVWTREKIHAPCNKMLLPASPTEKRRYNQRGLHRSRGAAAGLQRALDLSRPALRF